MSELAALVNVGSAGAVIAVVIIFLRYIAKHDEQLTGVIDRLVTRIAALEDKFDRHDATEMEFMRNIAAVTAASQKSKTQPKKPSSG